MSPGSGERWESSTTSARLADGDGHVPVQQHSSSRSGQCPDAFLCQRHVSGKVLAGMYFHRLKPLCGNICRSFKEVSSTPGCGAPEAQTSLCSSHLSFLRASSSWHHTPAPLEPSSFTVTPTQWEQHLSQHGKGPLCHHMCSDGSVRAGIEVAVALLMASTQEVGPGHPSGQHEDRSPAELHPGLAPHPHVLLLVQSFY